VIRHDDAVPFTLVLAGGGARGYAHAGVLRALEHLGFAPAGIVGVSMGAIVAATYALRDDWYDALLEVDLGGASRPRPRLRFPGRGLAVARRGWRYAQATWSLVTGWGAPEGIAEAGRAALDTLIGSGRLEEGRIPVRISATDLRSGKRVVFDEGPAAEAVYASSALAGVLQPLEIGDLLLVDGVYSDIAPVDVARELGAPVVVAVDPSQGAGAGNVANGLQVVMRAMEICHLSHAHLRVDAADIVLRPIFDGVIDVLNFGARRECLAAGIREVRRNRDQLSRALLGEAHRNTIAAMGNSGVVPSQATPETNS